MNTGNARKSTAFGRLPFVSILSCLAGFALLLAACTPSMIQVPGTGSSNATGSPAAGSTAAPTVVSPATATAVTGSASPTSASGAAGSTPMVITVLPAGTSSPLVVNTLNPLANGTTTPTAAAGTPAATGEAPAVTLADDSKTITLKVGQTFLLDLGSDMNWTPNVVDQKVVSRVIGITVIKGAQGVYQADAPGTTQLMATGQAPCRLAKPACAVPDRLFSVTIVVQP